MPHVPNPFYRTARKAVYVQLGRRQVKLAAGPDDDTTGRLAWAEFHRLMAAGPAAPAAGFSANAATSADGVTVAFEKYLDWCQRHRSPRTYDWSRGHVQSFCDHLGPAALMPAAALKPFHVQEWLDGKPAWGANQWWGAVTAVTRPFNWAAKLGYVAASPVRGIDRPPAVRREQVLAQADFDALMALVTDRPFRDVLEFCWETGCRVQEVRVIEARHLARGRVELPPAEAKGKKRWRVIYLTDRAADILGRVAADHPAGPAFRNADGNPWTAQAFNCRFHRLRAKLGVKYALTAIRHSYCQRKLDAGVDHVTVAALMGHVDSVMASRTYSHMGQADGHLRAAANAH